LQLTHNTSKFKSHNFPIKLICDSLQSPYNIGGIFRIADAFGIEEVILLNSSNDLGKRFKKTSRSTEKYVAHSFSDSFGTTQEKLLQKGYRFIALEITEISNPIQALKINKDRPIALVIGNENLGISEEILSKIDTHTHVEMYGVNSSLNVVQSASIALYEITNQLK
jgi:tRNA G18 (ribose-2'-O)-methylase SpoU